MTEHLIILGRTDSISPGNSSNLVVFAFSADLFAESSKSFAESGLSGKPFLI